jgi:hypothetical protein
MFQSTLQTSHYGSCPHWLKREVIELPSGFRSCWCFCSSEIWIMQ